MKKLISYLTLSAFLIGCVTPQNISRSDSDINQVAALRESHESMLLKDVQKLSDKLDYCIKNNSPLIDFWDKMILIPLEEYLTYDSNWKEYLSQKEQEYIKSLIPNCKKELLTGFERIGIDPKQQDYNMLRIELIQACWNNPKREIIRAEIFQHLTSKIDRFFLPIYDKAKHDVQKGNEEVNRAVRGLAESDYWANHSVVQSHYIDEIVKLRIRYALDKKYTAVIESEIKRFVNTLSDNQRQMFQASIGNKNSNVQKKFLKSLSPEQYLLLERAIFKTSFIQGERKIGKERGERLTKLAKWLDENKSKLEAMERESAQKRAQDASSIISGILSILGAAVTVCAMASYDSWRNVYYVPYQTPQIITPTFPTPPQRGIITGPPGTGIYHYRQLQ